jgi:phosphoribosylaminoimidazolecarboxamide formyltransferase/IMP cyclohydrolase
MLKDTLICTFAFSFQFLCIMRETKPIQSALISVYNKQGLDILVQTLNKLNITLYSTGGTLSYIENLGVPVIPVDSLTNFPEILGGRVKTLHPGVFGGILYQRGLERDERSVEEHGIHAIDLVVVDLYPFEETLKNTSNHSEIIEKIDIGGVSLLRAAAKNYEDVVVVSTKAQYEHLANLLEAQQGETWISQRQMFAEEAFSVTSTYDLAITSYFSKINGRLNESSLRYGENPHQEATFKGDLSEIFDKLAGKELSYNNLLDVDAAVRLIQDFDPTPPLFAIIKHNNACGIASGESVLDAYKKALEADPISAFGGVLISNQPINLEAATLLHELFFEILIAPSFAHEALVLLIQKKNRILLEQKAFVSPVKSTRSVLNGALVQDFDLKTVQKEDLIVKTENAPSSQEISDLVFANIIVKHTKSNAIALVKNHQLLASGTGQTSRVDALNQAIQKAKTFGFNLSGAVMASDAFFPFPDCVEIAHAAGINAVIQPGGSVKDQLSIDYCNAHGMSMVFTGFRHFKH